MIKVKTADDIKLEENVIYLLQRMYMEEDQKGNKIWEEKLWNMVVSLKTTKEVTAKAIKVQTLYKFYEVILDIKVCSVPHALRGVQSKL
jgi:hypothetical protein